MFKKIITIVLPILAVTAAIFIFGLKVYQDSFDKFQYDGYIIGASSGKESAKYHFSKDGQYKVNDSKNEVTFKNNEDKEVVIPEASFVHYADGSISTFKKAVVLNLENVKTDSLQYYNIFNGSVFTRNKDGYQIKYLEQKLLFNNFIVKSSDNKYMIVGKNLKIIYGEKEETIKDGFLEINYLDGNIIRIENQDMLLQNISTNFKIEVDSIEVDLIDKKIKYEDETKVNLGEITIDSDDNIEIIPDDENTVIDPEELNKIEEIENQPVVTPGTNMDGMESGVVDTTIEKADEIIQENEKIPDAKFAITMMNLTPISVEATVTVDDAADTLKGEIAWKIIHNLTNEILCQGKSSRGKGFEAQCNHLEPDSNYSLIVSSKYEKNEVTYEKDFLQRTFITPSAGISIEKDYVSTSTVSFYVEIPEESELQQFTYEVIRSDNEELKQEGEFIRDHSTVGGSDVALCNNKAVPQTPETKTNICKVTVGGLLPNTKYTLRVKNIAHSNIGLPEDYQVYKTLTTLKQTPTLGAAGAVVNKMSSKFVIYLNGISDPHNSVVSYRADVYPAAKVNEPEEMVAQRESSASGQIEIGIDEKVINRSTPYVAKIYLTYNDNEKEYEKFVAITPEMTMTSVAAPTIEFKPVLVKHDTISGDLLINDVNNVILSDSIIDIKMLNLSDGSSTPLDLQAAKEDLTNGNPFRLTIRGLRANTTYLFNVQARVKLEDNNEPIYTNIGTFTVQTSEAAAQKAVLINETSNDNSTVFNIKFRLEDGTNYTKDETDSSNGFVEDETGTIVQVPDDGMHELYTMKSITFRFRVKSFEPKTSNDCTSEKKCWEKTFYDETPENDKLSQLYKSTLKERFYSTDDKPKTITFCTGAGCDSNKTSPEYKFEIDISSLDYEQYVFEVVNAVDYTKYPNILPIEDNYISLGINPDDSNKFKGYNFDFIYSSSNAVQQSSLASSVYSGSNSENIFERDENEDGVNDFNQIGGYRVGPELNIPNYKETDLLEISYYLVDLVEGKAFEITYGEGKIGKRNNFEIEFTINDFNKYYNRTSLSEEERYKFKRGNPYAFYIEVHAEVMHEGEKSITDLGFSDTFRVLDDRVQPKKSEPHLQLYLSKTKTFHNQHVFKFNLIDKDDSIVNEEAYGKGIQYRKDLGLWNYATCNPGDNDPTPTTNCLDTKKEERKNEFDIEVGTGVVDMKIKFLSQVAAVGSFSPGEGIAPQSYEVQETLIEKTVIEGMQLASIYQIDKDTVENVLTYEKDTSLLMSNRIQFKINYGNYSDLMKERVVAAKITLNGTKNGKKLDEKIIYKEFEDNGWNSKTQTNEKKPTLLVDFAEIQEFIGADNVIPQIELLYDDNTYGYDNEVPEGSKDYGFALQKTRNGTLSYEKFSYNSKVFESMYLTYESTLNRLNEALFSYRHVTRTEPGYNGMKLKSDKAGLYDLDSQNQKLYYQPKKLKGLEVKCENDCNFSFTTITPSLYMEDEDITVKIGKVQYKFKLDIAPVLEDFELQKHYYRGVIYKNATTNKYETRCSWNAQENAYDSKGHYINLEQPMNLNGDVIESYTLEELEMMKDENGFYTIEEDNMRFDYRYCVSFSWSGKIEGKEVLNEENGTDNDFFYGSDYNSSSDVIRRKYGFQIPGEPTYYKPNEDGKEGVETSYDTGTMQKYKPNGELNGDYDEKNYEVIQSSVHNRTLTVKTKLSTIEGIDAFNIVIYKRITNEDGTISLVKTSQSKKFYRTSEMDAKKKILTVNFSLDPHEVDENGVPIWEEFSTGRNYTIAFTPIQLCKTSVDPTPPPAEGESKTYVCQSNVEELIETYFSDIENIDEYDGLRALKAKGATFSYNVVQPSITVVRVQSPSGYASPNGFAIRLNVDDRHRIVGNYSSNIQHDEYGQVTNEKDANGNVIQRVKSPARYNVKVLADGVIKYDKDYLFNNAIDSVVIDQITGCEYATSCIVEVSYQIDKYNDGKNFETITYQKHINHKIEGDIGTITIQQISKSNIRLNVIDSYNIQDNFKLLNFTFLAENGTIQSKNKVSVKFSAVTDTDNVWSFDIKPPTNLIVGQKYNLTISFIKQIEAGTDGEQETLYEEIASWNTSGLVASY